MGRRAAARPARPWAHARARRQRRLRHRLVDRPDAAREPRLLSARGEHARAPAALLRAPLPGGRGGRDLLRAAVRRPRARLGRAHARRLRVRREGARRADTASARAARLDRDLLGELPRELCRKRSIYANQLPEAVLGELWRRFHVALEPLGTRASVPPVAAPTSDVLAVVRFHGRNTAAWDKPGAGTAERFGYAYREDELGEWVPRIRHLAARTRQVNVLMNNCHRHYAVQNAKDLAALLAEASQLGA